MNRYTRQWYITSTGKNRFVNRAASWLCVCIGCLLITSRLAAAENEGQEYLDQATQLKLNVETMADLEKVVELCETALQKGLDDENAIFAKSLLTSTLYQRAARFSQAIFERQAEPTRWPVLRQFAMRDLDKALGYDDKLGRVHLLVARLEALTQGNVEKARQSAERAVELLAEDPEQLSEALVVRAALTEDMERRQADVNRAIELNPRNLDAWRARASLHLAQEGGEQKALDDLMMLLEHDPDDILAHQEVATVLARLKKFDEADDHLNKAIELNPTSALPHRLRAGLHLAQEKLDEALKDLDAALEAEPGNIPTLLMRSQVHRLNNDSKAARADIDRALEIQPDLPQAILQRSSLSASDERFQDAIDDMKLILSTVDDPRLQLQLARLYVLNEQPKLALDVYAELLKEDADNLAARRGRADALLSIGKQKEAIGDYEVALKANPEDDHVLNNLAWVLATSPDKDLRQGKRAVELATKACEITEYKAPHILSTLAAAYAELGDFGSAIEWSSKAVELDSGQIEQLAKELESYKQNKPWRELQEIDEKPSAPPQEPPQEKDLQPAEEP